MSTPVFYTSEMAGFPSGLTRTTGTLVAILDACLVNGANLLTATTLTQVGGVATATFTGNHNYNVGDKVLVEGATPSAYNGLQTVTAKAADSVSFAVAGGTSSPATGTVTVKHPGAGWSKLDLGTNNVGYRGATSSGGMGHWVQVEDNNPHADSGVSARLRLAENLTALNTADVITPTNIWDKGLNSPNNRWWVIADDRTFYIGFGYSSSPTSYFAFGQSYMVGELAPTAPTDTYAWVITRGYGDASTAGGAITYYANHSVSGFTLVSGDGNMLLRSFDGFRAGASASNSVAGGFSYTASLATAQEYMSATDPRTGAFFVAPAWVTENSTSGTDWIVRGRCRGLYHPLGKLDIFQGPQQPAVKSPYPAILNGVSRELALACTYRTSSGNSIDSTGTAQIAFDITGPWE